MVKEILIIFMLILLSGCFGGADNVEVSGLATAREGRRKTLPSSVSSVKVINNQLVISGTNLDNINNIRMTGPSSFDETFEIESKSQTSLIANGLNNIAFAAAGIFSLIITDVQGASTYTVTFTPATNSVTGAMISDMSAANGDALTFNSGTGEWEPTPLSGLNMVGTWDANTDTPDLADGGANTTPANGDFYVVGTAGTTSIDGNATWNAGDWILFNGSTWERVANSSAITSFNGRVGAVTPATNDYTWAQIDKTTSPIDDLSDVDTTGAISGSVLKFDGTNWIVGTDNDTGSSGTDNSNASSVTVNADSDGDASGDIDFQINSSTVASIKNNGDFVVGTNTFVVDDSTSSIGVGVLAPSYDLSFSGNADKAIGMERHTTSDTAGSDLFIYTGGATSGATDKDGGDLYIASGTATGTGSSNVYIQTSAASGSGTSDNTPTTKVTILGSGNVGIGTNNPGSELEVDGDITVTTGNDICISGGNCLSSVSAGQSNTASNVGTAGIGVFKQKTSADLEFKNINAGSTKITLTDDTPNNEIDIDVDESNINHDNLAGFVANEHIDHSSVSIATGANSGLTGGGDLTTTRNLSVDITGTTAETAIASADEVLIYDASATALRKMTWTNFVNGLATSATTITTGDGITGGGDLSTNRTISIDLATNPGLEFSSNQLRAKVNTGLTLDSNGINVDVGTGANQIVQLDGSSRLPAVDGSLLTNVSGAVDGSLALDGDSARTISMDRHSTADTAGNDLTVSSGGATTAATDKDGGNLVLSSGLATGTGSSSIQFQTATAQGSTNTTDNTPDTKMTILGSGNVGIGTTSPSTILDLEVGTVDGIRISGSTNAKRIVMGNRDSGGVNNPSIIQASNGELYFGGGNSWTGNGGTLDTSMTIKNGGSVGIGTTNPSTVLDVDGGADDNILRLKSSDSRALINTVDTAGNNVVFGTEGNSFIVGTGGAFDRLVIDNSGNVGIGSASPTTKLDVNGTVTATAFAGDGSGLTNITANSGGASNTTDANINADSNGDASGDIHFQINGAEVGSFNNNGDFVADTNTLVVDASANAVGIGVLAPTYDLSFGGNATRTIAMERHTTSDTAGNDFTLGSGGATSGATDKDGGDVYIKGGTSTGTGTSNIYFQTATAGSTGTSDNAPNTKMTILGSGNVGIGLTNPSEKLVVDGNIGVTTGVGAYGAGRYQATSTGDLIGLTLDSTSREWDIVSIVSTTPDYFAIRDNTESAERLVITETGNVGIGTSSPDSTALLQLNSTSKGFRAPAMTTTQRDAISTPLEGLMIYNDTTDAYNYYDGSSWSAIGSGASTTSCPSGFTKLTANGYILGCIQTANQATSGVTCQAAAQTCFTTYGGRLPSYSEAEIARSQYGISIHANAEWTDTGSYYGSSQSCGTISSTGNPSAWPYTNTGRAYRCFVSLSGGSPEASWTVSGANIDYSTGNVGIGSASPTTKLDVDGTVTATAFAGSGANLTNIPTGAISDNAITVAKVDFASTDGINIPQVASAPGSPTTGQMYFNTSDNNLYIYNGSSWEEVGSGSAGTGLLVNRSFNSDSTRSTLSTTMALNGSAPTNTEGTEVITVTHTPVSAGNTLAIHANVPLFAGNNASITGALFKDSDANAIAANNIALTGATYSGDMVLIHEMTAGTTSPITFKVRVGASSGSVYANGYTTDYNGAADAITIQVHEYGTGSGVGNAMGDADDDTKIQIEESTDEDKIRFDTAGSERLIIDETGTVGVGTTTPNATALMQLESTTKGFRAPAMTTTQRDAISTPLEGLMIYNDTTDAYNYYDGSSWSEFGTGSSGTEVVFSVHKNHTNQTVTTSSWEKVTWNTESLDTNSNFASDRFTPTVAGKYHIEGQAFCSDNSSWCHTAIFKNGALVKSGGSLTPGSMVPISIVLEMNGTTDYVELYAYNNGGTTIRGDDEYTFFYGYLLSGGGSADNLGDHTATANIQLGSNYLSGDGDNEGIQVDASGNVTIAQNATFTGNVDMSGATIADNSISVGDLDFASSNGINVPQVASAPGSPTSGQMYYNTSDNKLYVYNGSAWREVAGGSGTTLKYCGENDNCTGTVKYCEARSPDSNLAVSADSYTILYGSWSNTQCGTSGTGWHVGGSGLTSCSTGSGTKHAQCIWVLVEDASGGGSGSKIVDADDNTKIQVEESSDENKIRFDTAGSERMIIDENGNVGIGTSSPTDKLEVFGGNTFLRYSATDNQEYGFIGSVDGLHMTENAYYNAGWKSREGSHSAVIVQTSAVNNYALLVSADTSVSAADETLGATNLFTVKTDGNVGIGTTSPSNKLTIHSSETGDGDSRVNLQSRAALYIKPHNSNSTNMTIGQVNNGAGMGIQVTNAAGAADWDIALNPFGGNVGIGTTAPSNLLTLKSTGTNTEALRLDKHDSTVPLVRLGQSTSDGGVMVLRNSASSNQVYFSAGTEDSYILGNLGIGMTNPSNKLHVTGAIGATDWVGAGCETSCSSDAYVINYADGLIATKNAGGTTCTKAGGSATFSCSSDRNLKNNIEDFDDGLSYVLRLRPRTYFWNSDENRDKLQYGFIAQEVEEVIPHAVTAPGELQDHYTLDQGAFMPYLINAIKHLYNKFVSLFTKVEENERSIASLEEEVKDLKEENEMMKAYLCEKDPEASFCKK